MSFFKLMNIDGIKVILKKTEHEYTIQCKWVGSQTGFFSPVLCPNAKHNLQSLSLPVIFLRHVLYLHNGGLGGNTYHRAF